MALDAYFSEAIQLVAEIKALKPEGRVAEVAREANQHPQYKTVPQLVQTSPLVHVPR